MPDDEFQDPHLLSQIIIISISVRAVLIACVYEISLPVRTIMTGRRVYSTPLLELRTKDSKLHPDFQPNRELFIVWHIRSMPHSRHRSYSITPRH